MPETLPATTPETRSWKLPPSLQAVTVGASVVAAFVSMQSMLGVHAKDLDDHEMRIRAIETAMRNSINEIDRRLYVIEAAVTKK